MHPFVSVPSATEVVAPGTPMYWQSIAAIVETKTAHLCQLKHQAGLDKQLGHPPVHRKQPKKKSDDASDKKEETKGNFACFMMLQDDRRVV